MSWLSVLFGSSTKAELKQEALRLQQQVADIAAVAQRLQAQLNETVPKADESITDNIMSVTNFNTAYAAQKRALMPLEITQGLTDEAVVKLWVDRRNLEAEEPKLEIIHSDITPDGQVRLKLEWNSSFIRLLQNRGFVGDTEDDIIQAYLHQVTNKTDAELFEQETSEVPLVPMLPAEEADIEKILDSTNPDTLKALEKGIRRRAAQRGTRTRKLDK